ncbi:SDR family NAD(P)-dependent oxidoreductase [bacterium]|nr:MAG: SDR family NAD(P)-dependent oxidoreductase [bacterium]RKZ17591.1 MAG: SDR family NAD(P)-dependent oxidoreductase [bacterium]
MPVRLKPLLVFLALALSAVTAFAQESAEQKAILVTGASSGIGRRITERLAAEGYFVYAGARKDKDLEELNAIENVQSVRLDVTIKADIEAAVATVRAGGRGLYGLVNNAGVAVLGPLIEVPEEELDFQFGVNIYGPYRTTKAFAPMIIESKGRITTIGSISGILSGPMFGVYAMSKHAIEAYTDALAAEMERFDVEVSVIEPGNYRSKIGLSLQERLEERGFSAEGSLYAEQMERFLGNPMDRSQFKEPDEVADAALRALFDENPARRYMVVPNEREARITIEQAMRELVQLNAEQLYRFDRETLIAILDEMLAEVD